MKITVTSTGNFQNIDGVRCREWRGHTDKGVEVQAWIALVDPQTTDAAARAEFGRELQTITLERDLATQDMRVCDPDDCA